MSYRVYIYIYIYLYEHLSIFWNIYLYTIYPTYKWMIEDYYTFEINVLYPYQPNYDL